MHRALVPCVACLVVAAAVAASAAEPVELELEPGPAVTFTLGSTLHTVHGTIDLERGWIRFDPEGGPAEGEIVLDATSADTENRKRDQKMHGEVLRSGEHPTIVFRPTAVEGALPASGSGEIRLVGEVELLGVRHPATLPATVTRRDGAVDGEGSISIPYVAWGLEDPSVFVLRADKEVTVQVTVHGELRP